MAKTTALTTSGRGALAQQQESRRKESQASQHWQAFLLTQDIGFSLKIARVAATVTTTATKMSIVEASSLAVMI